MDDFTNSVRGQTRALNTLLNMYNSGRVPQALLFHGEKGVGKFKAAVEFAKLINSNSANKSFVQKNIEKLSEPYLKYVFPLPRGRGETPDDTPTGKIGEDDLKHIQDEIKQKQTNNYYSLKIPKANNIKISSIRDIKRFISMNFNDINYRVIIIENAELMSEDAQNALLKSLEEPPEGIIFILISGNSEMILPTIHSRCWNIKFDPLQNDDVFTILTENFSVDPELAKDVSLFSDGSISSALKLIDDNFEELVEKSIKILRYSLAGKYHTALFEFETIIKEKNTASFTTIISMIIKWLDDVVKNKSDIEEYYFYNHIDTVEKFNTKFPKVEINNVLSSINNLHSLIERKVTLNIIAMNIIFELHSIIVNR